MYFPVNSQTLVIGSPDTDTDNDFSNTPDPSYHSGQSEQQSEPQLDQSNDNLVANIGNMNLAQALDSIEKERARSEAIAENALAANSTIDWNTHMEGTDPEDDEFPIDRYLQIEHENDEEERTGVSTRLTARVHKEKRQRKQTSADTAIDWDAYMDLSEAEHPEDDEFPFDRRLRLAYEADEEERAGLSGRLTAPAHEVRRRRKSASTMNQNVDVVD